MEFKSLNGGITDLDVKKGIITGFLANFESKDKLKDTVLPSAFTKTIAERGPNGTKEIKYLLDHEEKKVVGTFNILEPQRKGLYYEAKAGRHAQGRDYLLMVEDGIVDRHSFGFIALKSTGKRGVDRVITELYMQEGSGLQIEACHSDTPILSIKSLSERASRLSNALHNGTYTDETFLQLADELDQIELKLNSLVTTEPAGTTQDSSEPSNALTWDNLKSIKI